MQGSPGRAAEADDAHTAAPAPERVAGAEPRLPAASAALGRLGAPGGPRAGDVMALQRAVRNGAVARLLGEAGARAAAPPALRRKLLIGAEGSAEEFTDGDTVRERVMDTLGANALSMENLARIAEDGGQERRFDTWEAAVEATEVAADPLALFNDVPEVFARRRAQYTYRYAALDPDGTCTLEVFAPLEEGRVGYATYVMQAPQAAQAPRADQPYTKEHVLGRYGKVAHLTHLYNLTLTRDGPADIYSGFGEALLQQVEGDARGMGARLMYLEPANSMVRTDPNTNAKQAVASKSFYTKNGYGSDQVAAVHNWSLVQAPLQGMQMEEGAKIAYIKRQLEVRLEGMLSKAI
jgi:hypothetical protein